MIHYTSYNEYGLKSWRFEASNDSQNWITQKDKSRTWTISDCDRFYRYFRIYMTGQCIIGGLDIDMLEIDSPAIILFLL